MDALNETTSVSERACATQRRPDYSRHYTLVATVVMTCWSRTEIHLRTQAHTHLDKTDERDTSSHTSDSGLSVGCSISIQPSVPGLPPPLPLRSDRPIGWLGMAGWACGQHRRGPRRTAACIYAHTRSTGCGGSVITAGWAWVSVGRSTEP